MPAFKDANWTLPKPIGRWSFHCRMTGDSRDNQGRAESACPLGRQSARDEARALCRMFGQDGNTVQELRELIAVPPRIELELRA
jgi:hypothetical protein